MMKAIKPILGPIISNGRLLYYEKTRACSIVRLKKRILDEFEQLRSKSGWSYQLEYCRNYDATIKRIKEAQEKGEGIPMLLFIYNGDSK